MSAITVITATPVVRLAAVLGVSIAVIVFLCAPAARLASAAAGNSGRVGLVEKDSTWNVVSPERGGASGGVWYTTGGPTLHFQLRARGLRPGLHYVVELNVDGKTYGVSSHAADSAGALALDTTLTNFAVGVCDKGAYMPPESLHGTHHIKFLVKRDGHPASGSLRQTASGSAVAPTLACHGNGDDNFGYALFEDNVAEYTGTR